MILVLRPDDHKDLLGFPDAIEAIEQSFRAWGEDQKLNLPRQIVNDRIRLAVHQATTPYFASAGLMAHTRERERESGATIHATSLVFDLETAALEAIVLGQVLCGPPVAGAADLRTAATSAVAMKHLARKDARSVGILGSGRQARSHLAALAAVRSIDSGKVFSPLREHREAYAREMAAALGIEMIPVTKPEAAVDAVDIVLVMTNTNEPVLFGEWLRPGQNVVSVMGGNTPRDSNGRPLRASRRDLDEHVLVRSDVIVVNSRAQAEHDLQADILLPIQSGRITWERVHELGELLAGSIPGRTDANQITLYKNNGGQGVADVAIASLAARRARQAGRGIEI
jgi:ornithine cyclodeaminase/alanine dehydrogenase-like protein (mu-crystallin family)